MKLSVGLLGLALLLVALPLAGSAPVNTGVSVEPYQVLGAASPTRIGASACAGHAPTVLSCAPPGQHSWTHGFFFDNTQQVYGQSYTGTLENRIDYAGGFRMVRCNYNGNTVPINCVISGVEVARNVPYTSSCRSYALFTLNPGGAGTWACTVVHDV